MAPRGGTPGNSASARYRRQVSIRSLLLDPRLDRARLRVAIAATALLLPLGAVQLLDRETSGVDDPHSTQRGALAAATPARNTFRETDSQAAWLAGTRRGATAVDGSLRIAKPAGTVSIGGRRWEWGAWASPWVSPGHGFTEVIPSWRATTPAGTWIAVQVRARTSTGKLTQWQKLGRWTSAVSSTYKRSFGTQDDGLSVVSTDTLRAKSGVVFTAYSVKVQVFRAAGTTATPAIDSVHAVASQLATAVPPVSAPMLPAKTLAVPAYSQMTHRGQYPQYGGGGQAWCSPTSLSMMLAYFGRRPTASEYSWVNSSYADPWVDEVARRVFDAQYQGTGNWPFNTAYAATRVPRAMVTRLTSLRDVERFIAAGLPVQVSITFSSGQLTGAPISGTAGHLVVVVGFTSTGKVIVNDPAASSNAGVRRTYDRAQFEAAWLRKSHGLAYVMRDSSRAFPTGYGLT
ncbi:peptidase C39 family protein [Nocardioides cavernaquae]|uniref:Peptidase C39 family protein n=1 Tax=Nocardioides cavernaquae TaxID=2321396 RepID=A0A3A5H8G3_9ACTN|nr:peptidase C39 family protein [Nocardioides cavernaquae]